MKILTMFLFLWGLCVTTVHSQKMEDVIYLKNGEVRRGIIDKTSEKPFSEYEQVKITSRLGNIFVYSADKIDSITSERYFRKRYYPRKKGYYIATQLGIMFNINDNDAWPHLTVEQGYQFNSRNTIGIGVEITELKYISYRPMYLAIRHSFSDKLSATYVSGHLGYAFPWRSGSDANRYTGGILVGGYFGQRIFTTDNTAVDFTMGYRYIPLSNIRTRTDIDGNDVVTTRYWYLNIIRFGVGLYFK